MTNDETACTTKFIYRATDTEGSDGSQAHTAIIEMGMNHYGETYIGVNNFNGALNGNATSATTATKATLLNIHNTLTSTSTRSTHASSWDGAISGVKYMWGQAFKDTAIGTDTGDIVLAVRPGVYTLGGTELCVCIDGDYYSMGNKVLHAGNYTDYTVTKTGTGASGTWGISISGTAAKATADASGNVITSYYCTLSTAQTISGEKTFSKLIHANNGLIINTSIQDHNAPWEQCFVINSSGYTDTATEITDKNSPGIGFHISSVHWGSLIFNADGFKFINNSATGYLNVTAKTFIGALSGNAATATKATQDGSGNVITSYYLNKYGGTIANRGTSGVYHDSALEIREYNYSGAGSDSWGQAPRLSFHWSNRNIAQIGLASNGYLYTAPAQGTTFYKLVYEYGTWDINISGTAAKATADADGNTISSTYLKLSGGTLTNAMGADNHNGILQIKNTYTRSSGYASPLRIISPNVTGTECIMIGPANSTKNAGYLGFNYSGTSGSNNNFLTLGLYAVDNAINIYGSGRIGFWSVAPSQSFTFYAKHGSNGCVADFWSKAENGSYIYFGGDAIQSSRIYAASVGYYSGLACIANETTYARIGVTDAGKPNFWTSSTSGKYELIVGNGYENVGPIKLTTGTGVNNASANYISAGRGYSTSSGLNGIKLVCTEQVDAISGIGQDCTGKEYELSIAAAQGTSGQGYITFVGHKMASLNTYTELGNFNFANSTFNVNGDIHASKVYGAVWNDYAEFRWVTKRENEESMPSPGRCVIENGNDSLSTSYERLQPGAKIISDTYGMCMGETEKAKTPIAVCGRVLAYPFERKVAFNTGDPVCSGPNGTVSRMTREEAMMYPERIVGTVVSKPTYKEWGPNKIPVDGRIWIQVK